MFGSCPNGITQAQYVDPLAPYEAPASGLITSWRVTGSTNLRLRVFHEGPNAELITAGTSAPDANGNGEANPTSLPIRAGDVIGIDQPENSEIGYHAVGFATGLVYSWNPALGEGVVAPKPFENTERVLLVNADIVLAPLITSIAPVSGGAAGGTTVTITGKYFDGATGVTFGSTPATSFHVDLPSQITAVAPASAAGDANVRVIGPGGSSEISSADRFTYTAPPATTSGSGASNTSGSGSLNAPLLVKPTASGFTESASKWRRGKGLPHISSAGKPPVGTTFSFALNEAATVSFSFSQRNVSGRRVKGACVAPTHGNTRKPTCKRTLKSGSFNLPGHAGSNKVSFQGRLSSSKTLKPGSYTLTITARDSHGLTSPPQSLSFTILPG
jgi:hypothetical protein